MIHSRSSLPTARFSPPSAALAKTIAAVGVLGGVLAIAVLASRDIHRPAEGRTRSDMTVPAAVRLTLADNRCLRAAAISRV